MAFNRKQRLRDNIEAVRTAFLLDKEQRVPTERERVLLERYCGFGGLKCILNPARELTDAVHWAKSDLELFAPTVELHRLIRENSKDETEYKRYMDSLKVSVLTAFYTPKTVTDTIADVLYDRKIRPATVLEPSAGMGAFIGSVLSDNPQADVMAFEKDLLTGKLLGHLYPQQKIRTEGFEKIEKPFLNHFDLAVSNIPFGDIAVFDPEFSRSASFGRRSAQKAIHDYFFLKGLDAVRDGGIVAFITSQGVLNSSKVSVRNEMFSKANLVSAIRLPNNLFTDNAGTEAGSDLIILQKDLQKEVLTPEERVLTIIQTEHNSGLTDNAYFAYHPERIVHTDAKRATDPYGKPAMVYTHSGGVEGIAADLYKMLSDDLSARLDLGRYNGIREKQRTASEPVQAVRTQAVQPVQAEVKREEKPVQKAKPVQPQAPVMDLYDLFGYTQEERRQAERGLKPKRGKTARREKQTELPLFSPAELKQAEVKPAKAEKPKPEPVPAEPAEAYDPEDALYRELDWETNPPINGFYELMMSLTPEKRAELRRLGKGKMEVNAAGQAAGTTEAKREKADAGKTAEPQDTTAAVVYPVENAFEVRARKQVERVEREMREEEAALTP